jgi:hypothetical protein
MSTSSFAASLLAFALVAGCGGKVVVDGASGSGAGGGSGGSGSGSGAGSGVGGATIGGCGGVLSCAADEYCDYADDACGKGSVVGVCVERPSFCDDSGPAQPVCGCNGKLYFYPCDAMLAGQDRGPNAGCPVESTYFTCGPVLVCDATQTYCQHSVSDVGGEPDGWACIPFPSCGGQTGCSCVSMEPCGELCASDANNHVIVTCPGG